MDLHPLQNNGDVSPAEFRQLFEARLGGELFARAMKVLTTLGPMHSFSVANVIHLGLQKQIAKTVIEALEKWCELFPQAPDKVTAHVDTRLYFDTIYQEHFMTPDDTLAGLGPFEVTSDNGRFITYGVSQSSRHRLWTP
ncbi:hypothetical protein KY386_00925 [Candidatus Parcubacteria bacterium]|nr:hypothetical protein [Candidatus Parcubacteria bacterium]